MSEISKAEGEAWQVGFEEGYNAGKREAADRIEKLKRALADLLSAVYAVNLAQNRVVVDPHATDEARAVLEKKP